MDDLVSRALDPDDDDVQLIAASGRRPEEPVRAGDIVVASEPGAPSNTMVVVQPPQSGVALVDPIVPIAAATMIASARRRPILIQRRDGLTRGGHHVVRMRRGGRSRGRGGAREDAETDDSRLREVVRRLSSPEDAAQRELVRQLDLPIASTDTAKIVKRYDELRIQFGMMSPSVAKRMHKRLTDSLDPLADFMRLELADWHRQELIKLAEARAQASSGTVAPPREPSPPQRKGPPITGRPPYVPPPIVVPRGTTPPPVTPVRPPHAPTAPRFDPKSLVVKLDSNTESWLANSLTGVAKMAGVGLSILTAAIPAGILEKAAEAAWLVYQFERLSARALLGLAGERAAREIAIWMLEKKLGIPASAIFDLNLIAKNFPGLDLIAPDLPVSVKTFGILSELTGEAYRKSVFKSYKAAAVKLFDPNHMLDRRYQEKVAKRLLASEKRLRDEGVWPSSLGPSPTPADFVKWIHDKGIILIPDDHVQLVRQGMGQEYFILYQQGKLPAIAPGLPDNVAAERISSLIMRRFQSSGLKSTDYRLLGDVASRLPMAPNALTRRKPAWLSTWGQPPSWTGRAVKP